MIIRVCSEDTFDIDISDTELRRYSLDFEHLRGSDSKTRRLVHDILGVLDGMGVHRKGSSTLVECDSTPGGCRLHVTLAREWFRFDTLADIGAAARAGLGDLLRGKLVSDGDGCILACDVPEDKLGLLLEFCHRNR